MKIIVAFLLIVLSAIVLIPLLKVKWKGYITLVSVCALSVLSSIIAFQTLTGISREFLFHGSVVTGEIPIRIDALSGWFILIINFTFITGLIYGLQYMKPYHTEKTNLSIHFISYVLAYASLVSICSLQNSLAFLFAWEIMALSSFFLIIFEHQKHETIKAGINFLIQSHVSVLFLMVGFIWVAFRMNSYDYTAITAFSDTYPILTSVTLFFCFFIGFAIKAGFVPFHTWLPYAHPACPSHVSGVMSGVIIKIGIYGMLRMLLLIHSDYTTIGYIILIISVISGVYGVMLAIVQHNLKKLLAYHSIENIGIIGMGIGLGCIGLGTGNYVLTILGFAGALLHTLNHSLFKSLLFYAAGNVYQSTHTMNIEKLGGLGKRMPHTTLLFLVAALAICGLPPFNGFVSEFIIYSGMFSQLHGSNILFIALLLFSILGLVLIGGLAIMCFTKAFGAVFLGMPRHLFNHSPEEASAGKLIPMYAVALLMIAIGIYPQFFIQMVSTPLSLFSNGHGFTDIYLGFPISKAIAMISLCSVGFIGLSALVFFIRKKLTAKNPQMVNATWGCGYVATNNRMQYTASSFIRSYRKLAKPIISIHKKEIVVSEIFPKKSSYETHSFDKIEQWFINYPLRQVKHFINRFAFFQNGNQQLYILYGVIFILLVLFAPAVFEAFMSFLHFLKQM